MPAHETRIHCNHLITTTATSPCSIGEKRTRPQKGTRTPDPTFSGQRLKTTPKDAVGRSSQKRKNQTISDTGPTSATSLLGTTRNTLGRRNLHSTLRYAAHVGVPVMMRASERASRATALNRATECTRHQIRSSRSALGRRGESVAARKGKLKGQDRTGKGQKKSLDGEVLLVIDVVFGRCFRPIWG